LLKPGDKLGAYEIVAQLKRGGMATLYLAQRTGAAGFAKQAAIKVVHPHLADDRSFVQMFLDEARLSARIDHPNVVHVYELGEGDDGMYYLVMEYVHGCSLSQLLRALAREGRKLTPEVSTWIAMRVAAGLHAAHELTSPTGERLGVVHRDISPQNILLAHKGYVKLIDFGIAKARGRAHHTSTGLVKGKFRYMAPEQASGRPVDARTDVYALGIVLWELLTMKRLFQADDELLVLDLVRKPDVPSPREHAPELPEPLAAAVMHALAPAPHDRPATADAFRQELARALPGALAIDAPDVAQLLGALVPDEQRPSGTPSAPSNVRHLSPESSRAQMLALGDGLRTTTVALGRGAVAAIDDEPADEEAEPPTEAASGMHERERDVGEESTLLAAEDPRLAFARPTVRMDSGAVLAPPPQSTTATRATVKLRAGAALRAADPAPPAAAVPPPTADPTPATEPAPAPTTEDTAPSEATPSSFTDVVGYTAPPVTPSRRAIAVAAVALVLATAIGWMLAASFAGQEGDAEAHTTDTAEVEPPAAEPPAAEPPPATAAPEPAPEVTAEAADPASSEAPAVESADETKPASTSTRKRRTSRKRGSTVIDGVPMVEDVQF
jgi:eukaryotic-like serine/threonine-protein kinase